VPPDVRDLAVGANLDRHQIGRRLPDDVEVEVRNDWPACAGRVRRDEAWLRCLGGRDVQHDCGDAGGRNGPDTGDLQIDLRACAELGLRRAEPFAGVEDPQWWNRNELGGVDRRRLKCRTKRSGDQHEGQRGVIPCRYAPRNDVARVEEPESGDVDSRERRRAARAEGRIDVAEWIQGADRVRRGTRVEKSSSLEREIRPVERCRQISQQLAVG
jgi:hypothetical protein